MKEKSIYIIIDYIYNYIKNPTKTRLQSFQDISLILWTTIVRVLGREVTQLLFNRSRELIEPRHPFFEKLIVTEHGLDFSQWEKERVQIDDETFIELSIEYFSHILHFVYELTGDVLITTILEELKRYVQEGSNRFDRDVRK